MFFESKFDGFLLNFGVIFEKNVCKGYLKYVPWAILKNLDFVWKVLQKWRFWTPGRLRKSLENGIENGMKKPSWKSFKQSWKIQLNRSPNPVKNQWKKQWICGRGFGALLALLWDSKRGPRSVWERRLGGGWASAKKVLFASVVAQRVRVACNIIFKGFGSGFGCVWRCF